MTNGWAIPDRHEVELALGSLVEPNLRQLFFGELQNPEWIGPLSALGIFTHDPAVWTDDAGIARARQWPEGEYLARMAPLEPDTVAELLLLHTSSENPWVHRVTLDAANAMPAPQAARLAPQIAKAIQLRQDHENALDVVALAEKIAAENAKHMRTLLTAAFRPYAGPEEVTPFGAGRRVQSAIDAYWFDALTPRLVPLLVGSGLTGLKTAVGWLIEAIKIAHGASTSGAIWRPSIAPHSQNSSGHEITDALINIARDASIGLATSGRLAEVVTFLTGQPYFLLTRVAVEATAAAVSRDPSPTNLEIAVVLLTNPDTLNLAARPEYVHLALATLPSLAPEGVSRWQAIVDGIEWLTDADTRRVAAFAKPDGEAVTEADLAAVRRRQKYRLLLPLETVLPVPLAAELAQMKTEFGVMDHPEFGIYITSGFSGPNSPVGREELAAMSADEMRTFLMSWEPPNAQHFGPSIDGLARDLEIIASEKPELLAAIAGDLPRAGKSYVRAAVAGWTKALVSGFVPPDHVWDLLVKIAGQPDDGDEHDADFEDDDPTWHAAQRGVADFATAYLTAIGDDLTPAAAHTVWSILSPMTDHPDPTPEREDGVDSAYFDPLTLALNSTRPVVLEAAIKLLHATDPQGQDFTELRAQILEVLAGHVGPAADPSLAVAAVFGEQLGILDNADSNWVSARKQELFSILADDDTARAWSDVVVSVALRCYQTSTRFIELMRPTMLAMLSVTYSGHRHVDGWRGERSVLNTVGNHIVTGYVTALIEDDDPLILALTSPEVAPSVVGEALGTLGWSIMRSYDNANQDDKAGAVPPAVLERARRLIDLRVEAIRNGTADAAQLSGFHWWIMSDVFPPSWSLPILLLAATDPDFKPTGMIGDSLARSAATEPGLTMEVFDALMPTGGNSSQRYGLLRQAPRILAAALTSGDVTVQSKARNVLDRLAREGHTYLLADVDQLVSTPAEMN